MATGNATVTLKDSTLRNNTPPGHRGMGGAIGLVESAQGTQSRDSNCYGQRIEAAHCWHGK
jgi:hypothetical protein